jgi:hypothetical protein
MSDIAKGRNIFIELIESIFRELGHPSPEVNIFEEVLETELESGEVIFEIIHSSALHPEHMTVRCKIGCADWEITTAYMTALLQTNQSLLRSQDATLGIDVISGSICHSYRHPVETIDASQLISRLATTSAQVNEWRATSNHEELLSCLMEMGECPSYASECVDTEIRAEFCKQLLDLSSELSPVFEHTQRQMDVSDNDLTIAAQIQIDNIPFSILNSMSSRKYCSLECDIGAIQEDQTNDALRRILELNHELFLVDSAGFSIDVTTGNVVYQN